VDIPPYTHSQCACASGTERGRLRIVAQATTVAHRHSQPAEHASCRGQPTNTHTHTHTHARARAHKRTHAHTRTHTHTRAHAHNVRHHTHTQCQTPHTHPSMSGAPYPHSGYLTVGISQKPLARSQSHAVCMGDIHCGPSYTLYDDTQWISHRNRSPLHQTPQMRINGGGKDIPSLPVDTCSPPCKTHHAYTVGIVQGGVSIYTHPSL
jgi:hypothetical protein